MTILVPKFQDTLETVDLGTDAVQLCYGSSFFKGLATGGNVSAAMSAMGERVTYGSFLTFTNNVLLLGKNTFHVLIIRSWSERLDHLVKSDRHLEAIELGIDYYQVWALTQFFLLPFSENSLICLEGKSMTPHRGNTILFRSSQQLPRLRLGPSKGFLS